ncbi:MAG TPA: cytochrome c maturation protein CcmE [Gammaproteobacteria bacterium]|nr:cytochrome c maturation protein CcmE [Gammaproteobacteria bacterium]
MNRKQKLRLTGITIILIILCAAITLILYALKQNINLFYTPTQLLSAHLLPNQIVRIGGYVKKQSVHYDNSGTHVTFFITDQKNNLQIDYHGVLPSLFREGQGIVVTGKFINSKILLADQVLAKHDEKYLPWPLAKELKSGEKNDT